MRGADTAVPEEPRFEVLWDGLSGIGVECGAGELCRVWRARWNGGTRVPRRDDTAGEIHGFHDCDGERCEPYTECDGCRELVGTSIELPTQGELKNICDNGI